MIVAAIRGHNAEVAPREACETVVAVTTTVRLGCDGPASTAAHLPDVVDPQTGTHKLIEGQLLIADHQAVLRGFPRLDAQLA